MGKAVLNMFVFSVIFWSLIAYDIFSHGTIESSRTGRWLKDAGLLLYVKPYYLIAEEQTVSLYRWSEKNFPYKEYNSLKNKTLEATKYIGHSVSQLSNRSIKAVQMYSTTLYNYISNSIPPDVTDKTLKYLASIRDVIAGSCRVTFNYLTKTGEDTRKWAVENLFKDKITWENVEKSYFHITQKIGIYYSNVTSWVGRKVECLISA